MIVTRVLNPGVTKAPAYRELIDAALRASPWADIPEAIHEVERLIRTPDAGVLMGIDADPNALAIVLLPTAPLDKTPQVVHFFNRGSTELRKAMISAIVDFVQKAGYNRFLAVNYTGKGDGAWKRVMKPEGWEISPIGSIMEFSTNVRDN